MPCCLCNYGVESVLARVPRKIVLAGRDPEYDHEVSFNSNVLVRCGSGDTLVPVEKEGGFRAATMKDQKEAGIVSDGLNSIDFSGLMSIQDVPSKSADLYATKILLENSRKHFMGLTMGSINIKYLVEIQLAIDDEIVQFTRRIWAKFLSESRLKPDNTSVHFYAPVSKVISRL